MRIIEELRDRELDVNSIQEILGISHSGVSQNLAILRSQHLVRERREGRRVIYSLASPALATWLTEGLQFLESHLTETEKLRTDVQSVKDIWSAPTGG